VPAVRLSTSNPGARRRDGLRERDVANGRLMILGTVTLATGLRRSFGVSDTTLCRDRPTLSARRVPGPVPPNDGAFTAPFRSHTPVQRRHYETPCARPDAPAGRRRGRK